MSGEAEELIIKRSKIQQGLENNISETPETKNGEKSSFWQTVNSLLKVNLGVGILTMAFAIKEAGILQAFVIILAVYLLVYVETEIVNDIDDQLQIGAKSLFDVSAKVTKKSWKNFISFLIFLKIYGSSSTYFLIFVDLVKLGFCNLDFDTICKNRNLVIFVGIIIVIPIVLIKNYTRFMKLSGVSNIIIVFAAFVTMGFSLKEIFSSTFLFSGTKIWDFNGFTTIVTVSTISIVVVPSLFEIKFEMEEKRHFLKALNYSFLITFLVTFIPPSIIYFGFRDNIRQVFLFNLPRSLLITNFVQITFAFALIVSFGFLLFPLYNIIANFFCNFHSSGHDENRECVEIPYLSKKYFALRIGTISVIIFIAIFVHNIISIVEMNAATVISTISFIIPAFLYEQMMIKHSYLDRKHSKTKNYFLLSLGFLIMIFNTFIVISRKLSN